MDSNKTAKMRAIGFKILKTCENCQHSRFPNNDKKWGKCERMEYYHLKHQRNMELGIRRSGICGFHEIDKDFVTSLGDYSWLLAKRN